MWLMERREVLKIFEALSNKNRLRMFRIMAEYSQSGITPTEIAKIMGDIPKYTLSFHLNALILANLCCFEKQGKSLI